MHEMKFFTILFNLAEYKDFKIFLYSMRLAEIGRGFINFTYNEKQKIPDSKMSISYGEICTIKCTKSCHMRVCAYLYSIGAAYVNARLDRSL